MTWFDKYRRTGRTTGQLKAMPENGIFISVHHSAMDHDKALARHIGRPDIQIVAPSWLTSMCWQGMEYSAMEIDHAYPQLNKFNERFYDLLLHARTRVRK